MYYNQQTIKTSHIMCNRAAVLLHIILQWSASAARLKSYHIFSASLLVLRQCSTLHLSNQFLLTAAETLTRLLQCYMKTLLTWNEHTFFSKISHLIFNLFLNVNRYCIVNNYCVFFKNLFIFIIYIYYIYFDYTLSLRLHVINL